MDVQTRPPRQRGYSLIEVMIALVVLSIGMLGIAGLTVAALKDTRDSFNRTKAVAFAWDMAERIRANRSAGNAYAAGAGSDGGCSASETDTSPSTCTSEALAAHDIFEWKAALADTERGLPGGTGTILFNGASSPPTYTITVTWSEGNPAVSDGDLPSVSVVTQI